VVVERVVSRGDAAAQREGRLKLACSRMGEAFAAGPDLPAVLDKVVSETAALLGAEAVRVLLLTENRQLQVAAASGPGAERLMDKTMSSAAGIAGEVIQTGRPARVRTRADQDRVDRPIENVDGSIEQALIAAPLHLGNEMIGVIEAAHSNPLVFSAEDMGILEMVATWTSIAVGSARQNEALQRRYRESETLATLSQALNEALDLERVLQLTVNAARRIIPRVQSAVIHLINPEGSELCPAATAGLEEAAGHSLRMHVGGGVAGLVLASGRPVNVADTSSDGRYLSPPMGPKSGSLLCAPIRSSLRSLGTISVQSRAVEAFAGDEEKLLSQLGVVAALAIEKARLFEIERRRLQEAEAMQRVTQAMISHNGLSDLLQAFITALADNTPYPLLSLYLASEGRVSLAAHRGYPKTQLPPDELPVRYRLAQRAMETATPALVPDMASQPDCQPFHPNVSSVVAVPLHPRAIPSTDRQVVGLLLVEATPEHRLDQNDLSWLAAVAMQLGAALERTNIHRDLAEALREEQATREQLVQAGKLAAMGRMVASVAHELNNPLQTIRNCLFLVEEEAKGHPESEEYLDMALTEVDRLARLVQQLREVYRPGSAGNAQLIDVCSLVEETRRIAAPHLERNLVRWISPPDPAQLWVEGSPDQLKQVLLNLYLNAVDAMQPEGGTITLHFETARWAGWVGVMLTDTGHSIEPKHLPLLFDPFFTTKETGMGLGLAICYDIIQRHRGEISVESNPDQGTTFTVWLPLVDPGIRDPQGKGGTAVVHAFNR